MIKKKEEELQL